VGKTIITPNEVKIVKKYIQRLRSVILLLRNEKEPCFARSLSEKLHIPTSAIYRMLFDLRRFNIIEDAGEKTFQASLRDEIRELKDSEIEEMIISRKLLFRNGNYREISENEELKQN